MLPSPPTTRLAPSPTGPLHLGHARSFLLAWLHARSRSGRILLRIEDLDRERCKPHFTSLALADLAWLGLDWDGEPHIQSADTAPLESALAQLTSQGDAYPCLCSRAEIAANVARSPSAPHAGDELYYPGTCGKLTLRLPADVVPAWRFRCPDEEVSFNDELAGPQRFHPSREVGDFAIARRDGAIAYQLAVVVDDARAGVDEIVRGADLLPSTARQILLQRALGLPHPRWWHLPLVVGDDGKRLAKRDGGFALAELRARGVDPRAVVAWALASSGLDAPERVTAAEACGGFELARIARASARFGAAELERLLAARA
ncbi:MAG: tRNA glutamyl-Q(34) synthetase GluQRS [Planctomycetota bacterium]|nr:MAG: tRNA glutamyl-Q(34) synthetase GluQRS [Planctomycetota bacterium]